MPAYSVFRFKNQALLAALAAAYPVISYSAGAASVDFATGNVMAVNAAGAKRSLSKGGELGTGEVVVTGDGRCQLRFTDGALISLQPGTEFKIDNYHYTGKGDAEEKGFFSLIKGGMRTITGLIGRSNRSNYQVSTSVATIGIRGTEYTAGLAGNELLVHTGEGLVEVCNSVGCVLLGAGESGSVQGQNQPKRTDVRPLLPPAQPDPNVMPVFSTGDFYGGMMGAPTSPMPTTGSAKYAVIMDASSVTETTGTWTSGKLNSASVTVNFGTLAVSASVAGTVNGGTFNLSTSGSISGNTLSSNGSATGSPACFCGCTGSVSGTFYGVGATNVGIKYSVTDTFFSKTFGGTASLAK